MTAATPYPLQWPAARARKTPEERKVGTFSRRETKSNKCSDGSFYNYSVKRELTMADALKRLQKELDAIGARYPVISSNIEVRLDGLPRSGARRPDDPGVAVYFQLDGKPHCFPCDTYTRPEDNIAAVAAHIEAGRAQTRHGVATLAEVFSGFTALPAPKAWWEVLEVSERASAEEIEAAFRAMARRHHPDLGGSHEKMAEINKARDAALKGAR